jgi:hypothetical protein
MAEFSKQWTEKNDPELTWDFDIEEVASNLEPEYYTPIICEGLGFIAIGKDKEGEITLAFPTGKTIIGEDGQVYDEINWSLYKELNK